MDISGGGTEVPLVCRNPEIPDNITCCATATTTPTPTPTSPVTTSTPTPTLTPTLTVTPPVSTLTPTPTTGPAPGVCEIVVGYDDAKPGNSNGECRSTKVNSEGLIYSGGIVTCP
jgi:hypothetical protein